MRQVERNNASQRYKCEMPITAQDALTISMAAKPMISIIYVIASDMSILVSDMAMATFMAVGLQTTSILKADMPETSTITGMPMTTDSAFRFLPA